MEKIQTKKQRYKRIFIIGSICSFFQMMFVLLISFLISKTSFLGGMLPVSVVGGLLGGGIMVKVHHGEDRRAE